MNRAARRATRNLITGSQRRGYNIRDTNFRLSGVGGGGRSGG